MTSLYRDREHVLFDQGSFGFRGKLEEESGGITVKLTHLDRLERFLKKAGQASQHSQRQPAPEASAP